MPALSKPLAGRKPLVSIANPIESRLAAPVVSSMNSKLMLGSTASAYLSNLIEGNAASAVITSLAQSTRLPIDATLLGSSSSVALDLAVLTQQPPANQDLTIHARHDLALSTQIDPIVSLSQMPTEALTFNRTAPIREGESQLTQDQSVSVIQSLAVQDHLPQEVSSLNDAARSVTITPVEATVATSANGIWDAQGVVNLSGIGTFITSNAPMSALMSLTAQNTQGLTASALLEQSFDGITVSGQLDSIDLAPLTVNRGVAGSDGLLALYLTRPANWMPAAEIDSSAYAVEQHTVVLIFLPSSQNTEIFLM